MKESLQKRFEIKKLIGEGAYTKVYEAVDREFNAPCALKIFINNRTFLENEESEVRFSREIELLKSINSDYIVNIMENGESEEADLWYTMELKEGSLRDLLLAEEIDSEGMKFSIAIQCLLCLEFIHENDIIHRDIKPENFLFIFDRERGEFNIYLSDFGYSKPLHLQSSLTRAGIGSVLYVSPEAAYTKGKVTRKSDIFSMGKVLYEIFTNVPFGDIRDIRSNNSCPPWLFSLCSTAAHNSPTKRYDNIFGLAYVFIYNSFNSLNKESEIIGIIETSLRVKASRSLSEVLEENLGKPLNLTDILIICAFPHIKDNDLLGQYAGYLNRVIRKFDEATEKPFLKIFSESIVNGDFGHIRFDREDFAKRAKRLRSFAFSALEKFLF